MPDATADVREVAGHALSAAVVDVPDGALVVLRVDTRILQATLGDHGMEAFVADLIAQARGLQQTLTDAGRRTAWLVAPQGLSVDVFDETDMAAVGWQRTEPGA